MPYANNPEENVDHFFVDWGNQIEGTGSDVGALINGLEGRDASGGSVEGWKVYNSVNQKWGAFIKSGIQEMQADIPMYLSQ
jgi:hypothetical protein